MSTHYAIVTFGQPSSGRIRSYYQSLDSARRDLRGMGGGSMSSARIVKCSSRQQALAAGIEDGLPVVAHN